jgi:uncharacterized damage-inducible protein DinB
MDGRMLTRTFLLITLVIPGTLAAQVQASRASQSGAVFAYESFADIFGSRLVAAFEVIPADRYDYRPTAPQQTIGYIAQHLEQANYGLCERFGSVKRTVGAKDSLADTIKARWPKDTLVARLKASLDFCDSALEHVTALDSVGRVRTLLAFETDLAEHYSQIAVYMRLLGMVPPSALPPKQRVAIQLSPSALSQFVGVYQLTPGLQFDVTAGDRSLTVVSNEGNRARLWPESANDFFSMQVDAQLSFTRDAKGMVDGFVLHQFGRDRRASKVR